MYLPGKKILMDFLIIKPLNSPTKNLKYKVLAKYFEIGLVIHNLFSCINYYNIKLRSKKRKNTILII
jgi:hypothetical protein